MGLEPLFTSFFSLVIQSIIGLVIHSMGHINLEIKERLISTGAMTTVCKLITVIRYFKSHNVVFILMIFFHCSAKLLWTWEFRFFRMHLENTVYFLFLLFSFYVYLACISWQLLGKESIVNHAHTWNTLIVFTYNSAF